MQVYEDLMSTAISFSQWMSWGSGRRVDDSADRRSAGPKVPTNLVVDLPDIGAWLAGWCLLFSG